MASSYPTSIDTMLVPAATLAGPDTHSDIEVKQNDAVVAVQQELGTDPAGAFATVSARLSDIETQLSAVGTPTWANFTPVVDGITTWSASAGRYVVIGKLVVVMFNGTIGTVGSDFIRFHAPVSMATQFEENEGFGRWTYEDVSNGFTWTAIGHHQSQKITARRGSDTGTDGHWSSADSFPTTFTAGDKLSLQAWYETP